MLPNEVERMQSKVACWGDDHDELDQLGATGNFVAHLRALIVNEGFTEITFRNPKTKETRNLTAIIARGKSQANLTFVADKPAQVAF
jgi:hypothetical protein